MGQGCQAAPPVACRRIGARLRRGAGSGMAELVLKDFEGGAGSCEQRVAQTVERSPVVLPTLAAV